MYLEFIFQFFLLFDKKEARIIDIVFVIAVIIETDATSYKNLYKVL
jgi:hypothetical protein